MNKDFSQFLINHFDDPQSEESKNKDPIISDKLAIWVELKERENPYTTNLSNDELRFRLGRRSIVKEILDLYRKQNGSSRSEAINDICDNIQNRLNGN